MKSEYDIERFSYVPSVFGENKRKYAPVADFIIENSDDYYNKLSDQIKLKLKDVRSIKIIF